MKLHEGSSMRLILEDHENPNDLTVIIRHLESSGIIPFGGATTGSRGIVLLEAKDLVRAAKILEEKGIKARID
jgi:hypothetical protein